MPGTQESYIREEYRKQHSEDVALITRLREALEVANENTDAYKQRAQDAETKLLKVKGVDRKPPNVGSICIERATNQAVCVISNDHPMIALLRVGGELHDREMCCGQFKFHEEFEPTVYARTIP